jgi:serine/threonine protein kinase
MQQNDTIGKYTLGERLGRGAMGEVFRTIDPVRRHPVAIKVMAADLSGDAELVERFRREALAASRLDHPNITRVYDFGEQGNQLFMTMEMLDGSDLKVLIEQQAITSLAKKLDIMIQTCAGMGFVHALEIVHRDLKPGNIHIKPDGCVKIMDFGLVRLQDSNMTRAGVAMGSPCYMAPELVLGNKADPRADVFSLGSVFYELLAGRRAFAGKGMPQILMNVMNAEPVPLAQLAPDAPRKLAAAVEKCLRKDPAHRCQNAGLVHDELAAVRLPAESRSLLDRLGLR